MDLARSQLDDDDGWLLYNSVGRYPGQHEAVAASLAGVADSWCARDDQRWAVLDAGRLRFLAAAERLMNAPAGTLYVAENVTAAFAAFIDSLPAARLAGRRVPPPASADGAAWWRPHRRRRPLMPAGSLPRPRMEDPKPDSGVARIRDRVRR